MMTTAISVDHSRLASIIPECTSGSCRLMFQPDNTLALAMRAVGKWSASFIERKLILHHDNDGSGNPAQDINPDTNKGYGTLFAWQIREDDFPGVFCRFQVDFCDINIEAAQSGFIEIDIPHMYLMPWPKISTLGGSGPADLQRELQIRMDSAKKHGLSIGRMKSVVLDNVPLKARGIIGREAWMAIVNKFTNKTQLEAA